jgi:hypothetical protein
MVWNTVGTSGMCFGWALRIDQRRRLRLMSQQSCQSCIIIIDSALYKGQFTDKNRQTIFPNYIIDKYSWNPEEISRLISWHKRLTIHTQGVFIHPIPYPSVHTDQTFCITKRHEKELIIFLFLYPTVISAYNNTPWCI